MGSSPDLFALVEIIGKSSNLQISQEVLCVVILIAIFLLFPVTSSRTKSLAGQSHVVGFASLFCSTNIL